MFLGISLAGLLMGGAFFAETNKCGNVYVAPLLQGFTATQIAPHSRFAAVMGFPAGPLAFGH
jgi:hypothetical protein